MRALQSRPSTPLLAFVALVASALLSACGGGGSGSDTTTQTPSATATVCFDAARSTVAGNTERHTYTVRSGNDVSTLALDITVLGAATFNGSAVVNSRWKTTATLSSGQQTVDYSLSHDSINGSSQVDHGTTFETSPGVTDQALTFSPVEVFRFDLTAGQSYSQSIQESLSGSPTSSKTRSVTTTFVGFEDVTVPAGTFKQACRFSIRETSNSSAAVSNLDTWLSRGDGVALKFMSTQTNIANPLPPSSGELVSGAINGRAIAP